MRYPCTSFPYCLHMFIHGTRDPHLLVYAMITLRIHTHDRIARIDHSSLREPYSYLVGLYG